MTWSWNQCLLAPSTTLNEKSCSLVGAQHGSKAFATPCLFLNVYLNFVLCDVRLASFCRLRLLATKHSCRWELNSREFWKLAGVASRAGLGAVRGQGKSARGSAVSRASAIRPMENVLTVLFSWKYAEVVVVAEERARVFDLRTGAVLSDFRLHHSDPLFSEESAAEEEGGSGRAAVKASFTSQQRKTRGNTVADTTSQPSERPKSSLSASAALLQRPFPPSSVAIAKDRPVTSASARALRPSVPFRSTGRGPAASSSIASLDIDGGAPLPSSSFARTQTALLPPSTPRSTPRSPHFALRIGEDDVEVDVKDASGKDRAHGALPEFGRPFSLAFPFRY